MLADTQHRLRALLTTPEGVAGALREAGDPDGRSLAGFVQSDARGSASVRLEIYANAWFQRILGALKGDYPALATQLGDAGINDLALAYLIAHPPRHPSLRYVGSHLADYLERDPRAAFFRGRWPWCADLARFETALLDAFDAVDAPVLAREQLARMPSGRWPMLRLRLQPSARVLNLGWDVAPIREAHEQSDSLPAPAAPEANVQLVWRRDETVRWRALDALEAALLRAAQAGYCFEELCRRAARELGEEGAPAEAAALLGRWVDAGVLTG